MKKVTFFILIIIFVSCGKEVPPSIDFTIKDGVLVGEGKEKQNSFLTSNKMIAKYFENLTSMCKFEHYPFEKPLHKIYSKEYWFSPIPSLAMHCTNINSIYGLPPNFNIRKIWDESAYKD